MCFRVCPGKASISGSGNFAHPSRVHSPGTHVLGFLGGGEQVASRWLARLTGRSERLQLPLSNLKKDKERKSPGPPYVVAVLRAFHEPPSPDFIRSFSL